MAVVVDSSVTMAWCSEDETSPGADAVLDSLRTQRALVPPVWRLEVATPSDVSGSRRRSRLGSSTCCAAYRSGSIPPTGRSIRLQDGRRHELTAYDACYLELAARTGAALATLNDKLATAARAAGVDLAIATDDSAAEDRDQQV